MRNLWAPWRIKYIRMNKKSKGCFLCEYIKENRDRENLILYRGKKAFIIMNKYPYNNGHLMVAPYRHVKSIEDLFEEEISEIFKLLILCKKALDEEMNPNGFNIGLNIGRAAGAGEEHLHFHIVPRWVGDTNFMPVISDTKVISQSLLELYDKLKPIINRLAKSLNQVK